MKNSLQSGNEMPEFDEGNAPSRFEGRFDALDSVRATAMLLGVLYHALLFGGMYGRGGPPGVGMMFSLVVQEWLHSFRMPLFFLISGFFCRMMFVKYGTPTYLRRRWSRIGLPLLVSLLTIVPFDQSIRGLGGGPPGPPPGGPGQFQGGPPPGFEGRPPGPPPDGFPPMRSPDPDGGPPPGMGPPRGMRGFGPQGPSMGSAIFGPYSRLFRLEFLWFLWYLLVFATVVPLVLNGLRLVRVPIPEVRLDALSRSSLSKNLAPLFVGLASVPGLMRTTGFGGWSLGLAAGIFRPVPDFLFELQPDMPFYGVYFLAGWWLHRHREGLGDLSRHWRRNTLIGTVVLAAGAGLSIAYSRRREMPNYELIRVLGYSLNAIGSAYTAFAFLGFFQRNFDQPTKTGRYLSDTALWVYLIHLPLLTPVLSIVSPLGLPWWISGILVSALVTGIGLAIFEGLIRPTPLVKLFGPARLSRAPEIGGASTERR